MGEIIFKTELIKGAKGDRGEAGQADSIPTDGVIAFQGETVPDGYEETDPGDVFDEVYEDINAVKDMIADEYDTTATYNAGDYCTHENVLYKCKTDNTTGIWDSSKWDAVTVAVELGELTERVSDRYVSVVGDGVKTYQQLMNDLYALVDRSKLTKKSKFGFYYNSTLEWYCSLSFMSANKLQFDGITGGSPTDLMTYHWELSATLADCYRIDYSMTSSGLTINNETMTKPASTNEYRVYY